MQKVCVTGGSGGAGNAVIRDLLAHGYACVNLDIAPPRDALCPFVQVDMHDYAAVLAAMEGCDLLVHFAGNPHPDDSLQGAAERFADNTVTQFNAVMAAIAHGIKRIVWASSETIYGFPFETNLPGPVPLTETSRPDPQTGYAVSKAASERAAELLAAQHGVTMIGLRLSNVLYDDPDCAPSFQKIPSYWPDPQSRKFNLWGYVDGRDCARAVRLALTSNLTGSHIFNIAAPDTVMHQDTKDLIAAVMPGVEMAPEMTGRAAMLDCSKARALLGWEAEYTWTRVLGLNPAQEAAE